MTPEAWHGHPAVSLENDAVALVAVPSLGGRVVSLVDRRTGRDWLVQGEPPGPERLAAWAGDDAVFGGKEAFGWDECLPTVAPCADPLDRAAPPLRDHGDQWGRPADVEAAREGLAFRWASPRWPFVLHRSIHLDGPAVVASYELESRGPQPIPVLWSMHALLALEPDARLVVEPPARARVTHEVGFGLRDGELDWPAAPTDRGGSASLDVVRGIEAGQAAKLYLDATALTTVAARTPDGAELRFSWSREVAPALGIWLDFGGWPPGAGRHQVALEPTTSGHDDLAAALAAGRARRVEASRPLRWQVRIELRPGRSP